MLLISAQRREIVRVPFFSSLAAEQEWDAIVFFSTEERRITNALMFFTAIAGFNCPRDNIICIDNDWLQTHKKHDHSS